MDKWSETTKIESHQHLIIYFLSIFFNLNLNLIGNSY